MDPQQTRIYTAVLSACIIIGFIIAYFIFSLIRHQRRYVAIARRNVLAELSLLEKDRMRIAADLHDDMAPLLSATKFQLESIDTADPSDLEVLNAAKSHLDTLSARVREIARDLMPATLTKKGLQHALNDFFSIIQKASSLKIIFKYNITNELPEEKRIHLYRIIQEITHNTIKHAGAKDLLIQIQQHQHNIQVICEDNGKGFAYSTALQQESGLGLRNIKSRVEIIGNNLGVKSVIGKGTQYIFDIPLN